MATTAVYNPLWQFLTKYIELLKDEPFFLKNVFGSQKLMSPATEIRWRTIAKGGKMADLGARGDPAKAVNLGVSVVPYVVEPPQIFERDEINSTTPLLQSFDPRSLANLETSSDIMRSIQYLYGVKLQGLKDRIARRIDWMFAELLTDGTFTATDGVRSITQSYDVSDAVGFALNSGTDPLDLLGQAVEAYAEQAGKFPNICIMSANVARSFLSHAAVAKWITKNTYAYGQLTSTYKSPTIRFLGRFDEFAIPEIYVYRGTYNNSEGAATKYIEDNHIILTDTAAWNLGYGALIDYEIDPTGAPIMNEITIKEKIPEASEGHTKTVSAITYPLPILLDSNALYRLTVTIS